MHHKTLSATLLVVAANAVSPDYATAATPDETASVETIEVVATTPLGAERTLDDFAGNVQVADAATMRSERATSLAQFMAANFANVILNEAQSNPLQPDLQYRGFVASPLLGLPQGLAVYQNGVRINEPFGDTVNWALIPDAALESIALVPGANPLYGLNTLGGAVAIKTRDGSKPGFSIDAEAGSFGHRDLSASAAGSMSESLTYFVTASHVEEDGWRDFSPTELDRGFASLGWQGSATTLDLNVTFADTDLIGNGAAPIQLLDADRSAIYTRPDQTKNDLLLLNGVLSHDFSERLNLTANAYKRSSDITTFNGDDSDFEECEDDPGFICEEEDDEEEIALDADGNPIPATDAVEGGLVNRSQTRQDTYGFSAQLTFAAERHFTIAGVSFDTSDIVFASSAELAALDATRAAVPSGFFLQEGFTALDTDVSNTGLFVSHTWQMSDATTVTVSGRYNRSDVELRDRLGTALNGDHDFSRFNPSVGVTHDLGEDLGVYAGYAESNRVPSPVELTCADPDDPCRLPNAFLADPPLDDVVARTFEAGIRGSTDAMSWSLGVFATTNDDDILFISAGALTNEGYFDNVGRTKRRGFEAIASGAISDKLEWFANYAYLDATFADAIRLPSPNNPRAVDGEVSVRSGDALPLLPNHTVNAGASYRFDDRVRISLGLQTTSEFHLRGDEGGDVDEIDGYTTVTLKLEYQLNPSTVIHLDAVNLLDSEYETFGLFGEADEVLGDDFDDPRFLSPGSPRAWRVGFRFEI